MAVRDDPVAQFFSDWRTYRAVIEADCMEHQQIYQDVGQILAERSEPFSVLDLGCGDAAGVASALGRAPVAHYTGVDCAGPALELAAATLEGADFTVELVEKDLADAVTDPAQFDVVLMAFALHHFQSAQKRRIISDVRERLKPGGELLLIDVVRRTGQSREDYLDAYEAYVREWPVSSEAVEAIIAHVRGYDFPEEESCQPAWAGDVGFSGSEQFYAGGAGTQRGWRLFAG